MRVLRLFTDGAARGNPGRAGAGVVIEDENGMRLAGQHRWLGEKLTNNEAEYLALIDGLKAVQAWKPDRVEIYMDSKLVVEQVNDRYRVKEARLKELHQRAKTLMAGLQVNVSHVEREKNRGADALANKAIDSHG
jgi:ribonuclease HI